MFGRTCHLIRFDIHIYNFYSLHRQEALEVDLIWCRTLLENLYFEYLGRDRIKSENEYLNKLECFSTRIYK